MPDINQIGKALQGFSAGLSGRGTAFNQQMLEEKKFSADQERQRLQTGYLDAAAGKQMATDGNWQGLLELSTNRMRDLQTMGVKNSRQSEVMFELATLANSQDPKVAAEAQAKIKSTLTGYVNIGQAIGVLQPPAATKPTHTNFKRGSNGEVLGYNTTTGVYEEVDSGGAQLADTGTKIVMPSQTGLTQEQKALGNSRVARFEKLQEAADNSIDQDEQLAQMESINISTGFGQEARASLAGVINSIAGPGVGDSFLNTSATLMQSFRAVSKRLQATELNKAKGPQTEGDAKRIMDTIANMGNEPDANKFLVQSLRATNARKIEQARFYESVLEAEGTLKNADRKWTAFKRKTPMLSDAVRDKATGFPMFYKDFAQKAKERNPDATQEQIINAWRELN